MSRLLTHLADQYLDTRTLDAKYAETIRRTCRRCQDLCEKKINAYLLRRKNEVSATTVANERRVLMTVWTWAYENRLVENPPRGVQKIRHRRPPIRAWTPEQVAHAIELTELHRGNRLRSGANLGVFLRCWLVLGYESGARWGDLWKMREDDFDGDALRWRCNKTDEIVYRTLTNLAVESVGEMLDASPDGRVLGWAAKKRHAMRLMHWHLRTCDLPGSSKWLRRSAATHVEKAHPGKARLFLGHRTPHMADQHYIDYAQIGGAGVAAPRLPLTGLSGRPCAS